MLRIVLLALVLMVHTSSHASEVLTNQTVMQMVKLSLSDDIVMRKIQTSICQFDTSPAALSQLQGAGVSSAVIGAMMDAGRPTAVSPTAATTQPYARPVVGQGGTTFGLMTGSAFQPMASTRVSTEISNRKSWIPVYGKFASSETFLFIQGTHAATTAASRTPDFVTTIDPSRLRLVELGAHKRGDRYVVLTKGQTKRELGISAVPTGSGAFKVTPSQTLTPGEYAWLVSPEGSQSGQSVLSAAIAAQMGGAWSAAYDFAVR